MGILRAVWNTQRAPFAMTLGRLFLVLCSITWFTSEDSVICHGDVMGPGDVCQTVARGTGKVMRERTYEDMRAANQRWYPILAPIGAIAGVGLFVLGIRSAFNKGILFRGQQRRPARSTQDIGDSAYPSSIAQRTAPPAPPAATPLPPTPPPGFAGPSWTPPAPPPPGNVHHDG